MAPTPSITQEKVRALADLAQLALSDEETARMAAELAVILDYVRELEAIDVTGVEPTAHGQAALTALREDVPREGLGQALALREAPVVAASGFCVPGFVDEG